MDETERDPGIDGEFIVGQDGDYEPEDGPADGDERAIEEDDDAGFPDEARPVVLEDEPDAE